MQLRRGDEPRATLAVPLLAGLPPGLVLGADHLEDVPPPEGQGGVPAGDGGVLAGVVVKERPHEQLATAQSKLRAAAHHNTHTTLIKATRQVWKRFVQAAGVPSLTVWTRRRNQGDSKHSWRDLFSLRAAVQWGYLWLAWWRFFLGEGGDDGEPHLLLRTGLRWRPGRRVKSLHLQVCGNVKKSHVCFRWQKKEHKNERKGEKRGTGGETDQK